MAPEAQLPVLLYWDSKHIKITARPWPPKHSTPGIISSRCERYFPSLLPGTVSLQDISPTVAPVTVSAHLLSDLIVSYNVSYWRQINVCSPLHRRDNSLSFLALLPLLLTGNIFLHCLNDHFIFIYPVSHLCLYFVVIFVLFVFCKSARKEWGNYPGFCFRWCPIF